ncbi:MAG: DUF4382 domain-containing protein [Candidatus Bathyarchaeia archaeon]
MEVSKKTMSLYGVAGVLIAVLIIAGIAWSGMTIPNLRLPAFMSNTGTLIVQITDAPVELEHLNVTINSVSILKNEDGSETWVDLPFVDGVEKVSLDLLTLKDVTQNLSISEIDAGKYTKIRLSIEDANATYVGDDWEKVHVPPEPIHVPPGHIDIIVHFEIEGDEDVTVLIDMNAEWIAISQSGNLRPVLKAVVEAVS